MGEGGIDPFNFARALTLHSGFLYNDHLNLCRREKYFNIYIMRII